MTTNMLVAVSGQLSLQQQMDAVAHNIANVNTTGFRAEGVKFETVLTEQGDVAVSMTSSGEDYVSRRAGPVSPTGNPLDVAIDGEGWFSLQTNDGRVYTRDGRFHVDDTGRLLSTNDYAVLDPGGAPIVVEPAGGPIQISEGGLITQDGGQIGAIGVFLIPEDANLTRHDNSAVVSDLPVQPAVDTTASTVRQGYLEGSNVNPVMEIARMIEISRAYESAVAAVTNADNATQQAVRTLAAS